MSNVEIGAIAIGVLLAIAIGLMIFLGIRNQTRRK